MRRTFSAQVSKQLAVIESAASASKSSFDGFDLTPRLVPRLISVTRC